MGYTVNLCNQLCFPTPNCFQFCHDSLQAVLPELRFQIKSPKFPAQTLPLKEKKLFICLAVIEKLLNGFCSLSHVNINSGQIRSHKILQFRVSEGTVALFPGDQPETQSLPTGSQDQGMGQLQQAPLTPALELFPLLLWVKLIFSDGLILANGHL